MTNKPTHHPHADLIIEWLKDTSRAVQYRDSSDQPWKDICFGQPNWSPYVEYRFTPHKWQECIDAQKAGKMIQARNPRNPRDFWKDGHWDFPPSELEYRIKPEVLRYRVGLQKRNLDPNCKPTPFACWEPLSIDDETGKGITRFVRWLEEVKEVEL